MMYRNKIIIILILFIHTHTHTYTFMHTQSNALFPLRQQNSPLFNLNTIILIINIMLDYTTTLIEPST